MAHQGETLGSRHKAVVQLEEEIDRLLESLTSDIDEVPESERVSVVWSEPHFVIFMLESRARMLAEAWIAVHEHETWGEAESAVSPETAAWLAATLTEYFGDPDLEDLTPNSPLSLFTEAAVDYADLWPYPNSEEEFAEFVEGLSEAGKEIIGEAFSDEVVRWLPTTLDGLVVSIDEPEELAGLLVAVGIQCRRDDELIRAALGTWT